MIVSSQHKIETPHIFVSHVADSGAREALGDFHVSIGSVWMYFNKDQLLQLMYECETALHRSQEHDSE